MIVNAALEPSGVTDAIESSPIFVSTTARIMYRRLNPSWDKARNADLNKQIADQFSAATHEDFFRPKKSAPHMIGEIRVGSGTKFIALVYQNQIMVIAAKGSPKITSPAPVKLPAAKEAPAPIDFGDKTSSLKTASRNRGFMEDHFFDMFQGMYALDEESFEALKRRAKESGNPIGYLKDLHVKGSDAVAAASVSMPEPQGTERGSAYAVPVGIPI